jgi:hypothetical protein
VLTGIGAAVLPTGLSVGAAHSRLGDEIDRQLVANLTGLLTDALEPAAQGAA